jgi:hypothetical protein
MARLDDIITEIRATAFELGSAEMARRSELNEDTVRRLLKTPPTQIENLRKLEGVSDKYRQEKQARGAEETA